MTWRNIGTLINIFFYENIGHRTMPVFGRTYNGLSGLLEKDLGIAPIHTKPAFGDFDLDGDLDIVAGGKNGGLQYYENIGSSTSPDFRKRFGSLNPLSGQIVASYSAPVVGDLDGDSDLDVVVGDWFGGFSYFETTFGTGNEPEIFEEQLRETVVVDMAAAAGFKLGPTFRFVAEIEDDDVPTVSLDPIEDIWEDVGQLAISASLSHMTDKEVIVPFSIGGNFSDDSASAHQFSPDQVEIRIPAGSIRGTATIIVNDNSKNEPGVAFDFHDTFMVSMGKPRNAVSGKSDTVSFQVMDDDPKLLISGLRNLQPDEGDTSFTIPVGIYGLSNDPIQFTYEAWPGSAGEEDYDDNGIGVVTMPILPPETTDWKLEVPISLRADGIVEGRESFQVNIAAPGAIGGWSTSNAGVDGSVRQVVSVLDNDSTSLSIKFLSDGKWTDQLRVDEDAGLVPVAVRLSNPISYEIDVNLGVRTGYFVGGSANPDVDYEFRSLNNSPTNTVRVPAGSLSALFYVKVNDDKSREYTEDARFMAWNDSLSLRAKTAYLNIVDNDTPPTSTVVDTLNVGPDQAIPTDAIDAIQSAPTLGPIISSDHCQAGVLCGFSGSDGFISGGLAFFDGNENGVLDFLDANNNGIQAPTEATEPSAITAADGSFALTIPSAFDRNADGQIDEYEGQIVLTGGVDASTGMPLELSLTSPAGFFAVTPVTSLVNQLVRHHGLSGDAAQTRVLDAFGIQQTDLRLLNPIGEHLNSDPIATDLVATGAMIQDTVVQIAQLVSNAPNSPPYAFVADQVFQDMAAKLAADSSSLNLSLSAVVESIINGTLFRTATELDSEIVRGAASVITAANRDIDTLNVLDPETFLRRVVQTQVASQGVIADALADVAAGNQTIQTIEDQYIGENLQDVIAAAEVQDVLPPVLAILDVSESETEGQTTLEFTVALLRPSTRTISVDFATADHLASVEDGDYVPTSGTLTWEPGDNTERTIQVTVNGDTDFETDEQLLVILSNAVNAAIRRDLGVGTIINDDALTFVAPNDTSGNHMELLFNNGQVQYISNGVTLLEESFSAAVPITIIGAADVGNELVVTIVGDNPVLGAGVSFQGSPSQDDVLTIYDGASNVVVHAQTGPGEGSFDVEGSVISYSNIETTTDSLATNITGLDVMRQGGDLVSLGTDLWSGYDSAFVSYQWSVSLDGQQVAASTESSLEFLASNNATYDVELIVSSSEHNTTGTQRSTIEIRNVDPTANDDVAGVSEDGSAITIDLTGNDTDPDTNDDVEIQSIDITGTLGAVLINTDHDTVTYSPNGQFERLAAGQAATDTFAYLIDDGHGGSSSAQVTVTIHGVNDPATISGTSTGSTNEDSTTNVSGTLTVADVDEGENVFAPLSSVTGAYGSFDIDAVGTWTYTLDNNSAQDLNAGDSLTDSITVVSVDGTATEVVMVTIDGLNDAATISGTAVGTTDEDSTAAVTGTLAVADVDDGEDVFTPQTSIAGTYGTFDIDAAGRWTYTLNNSSTQHLNDDDSVTDSFTVVSVDGTANEVVRVTIGGLNDAATISGDITGGIGEDEAGVGGLMVVNDVDEGESVFQPLSAVAGAYGRLDADSVGNWTYTRTANLNAMSVGEVVTEAFVVVSADGTASETVAISITGVNDAPAIASLSSSHDKPSNSSADSLVSIDGVFSDVDLSDTHVVTVDWGDASGLETLSSVNQVADTFAADHNYATGGVFTVLVQVHDEHGGSDTSTTTAVSQGVGLVDGTLYIIGTDNRDHVNLKFNKKKDELKVDAKLNQGGRHGGSDGGKDKRKGGSDGGSDGG
ncbi:MAG: hypothetical protein GY903_12325, partial [Fuerstiella sp.]|nr:hypothetical protein [Fuerstiella sp.]MCP4855268.1 hypothetical protein [Fuerstiella sp.]